MTIKENLIQSAMTMFLKYGVKSVSMDDIARLLGISKKTIYDHVDNKKDLVSVVIESFIKAENKEIKRITKNASNALDEMTSIASHVLKSLKIMKPKLTFDLQKYHPKAWKIVENTHFKFMEETVRTNITRGKKEGIYREDLKEDIISKIYLGVAKMLVEEDMNEDDRKPLSEIYHGFIIYHLNGIVNTKGRKELKIFQNKSI